MRTQTSAQWLSPWVSGGRGPCLLSSRGHTRLLFTAPLIQLNRGDALHLLPGSGVGPPSWAMAPGPCFKALPCDWALWGLARQPQGWGEAAEV